MQFTAELFPESTDYPNVVQLDDSAFTGLSNAGAAIADFWREFPTVTKIKLQPQHPLTVPHGQTNKE